jgi:hypothetical protein
MLLWATNGFKEDSVSRLGPVLWYDASTIGAADSTAVSTWNDRSGNGYNATQTTSASQPTFYRSDSLSSNRPSVFFDGTDDYLLISSSANSISKNIAGSTVFVVKNITGTGSTFVSFSIDNGTTTGNSRMTIRKASTNVAQITGRRLDADAQRSAVGTTTLSTTIPTILSATFDYAITRNMILYINNISQTTGSLNASVAGNTSNTDPINGMVLGAGVDSTIGAFMQGYICEFLFFNKLLSIADSTTVFNYLKEKYGL